MTDVDWDGLVQTLLAEINEYADIGATDDERLCWNMRNALRESAVRMRHHSDKHEAAFGEALLLALM